ncbi:elongation of very long chain fatty acids protein 6-like [Etheostoma cragini]|uniref:elongation of very long chain fatty acids protein 6-like n=1 Tax=Etheostoma cragini TaxID=417921 RepID=UPI00155DF144|nr:elongation of very long chain fatty acids protein 6-like [Etheostoma cragini]
MNASELNAPLAEYDFERIFDERRALEWMQENCSVIELVSDPNTLPALFQHRWRPAVVAMTATHLKMARLRDHSTNGRRRFSFGRSLMKCCPPNTSTAYRPQNMNALLLWTGNSAVIDRTAGEMKVGVLTVYQCVLHALGSLCSIIGALRTGLYMLHVLTANGFRQSVCDTSFYSAPVSKFWAYAFVLSKAPELGDTVFIILRKQRLIFLHWYHHITVLLYSWYSYKDQVAGGGWFMTMNYVVHSLMYTYYAARAAGLRVPRPCAMVITATQILQMVMGLAVLGLVYHWMHDVHCPSNVDNVAWGFLMYLSYLVLFALFFYDTYLRGSSGDKASKAE